VTASNASHVRTFSGEVSICPTGADDCRLTLVDHSLCDWLSELFDPSKETFHDDYNCIDGDPGVFACVNVLTRRKKDDQIKTDYIDPYLIELAALYESELDQCLPAWRKSKSMARSGPALLYEDEGRLINLSIIPYSEGSAKYDRLTLEVRIPR
jgi:hypothetical protein